MSDEPLSPSPHDPVQQEPSAAALPKQDAAPEPPAPWVPPAWLSPRHPVGVIATLLTAVYVIGVAWFRFREAFRYGTVEGDSKQVIWMFYQIADPGSLAGKSPLLDYSWAYNAPPLYRLVMTMMSKMMDPIIAGHTLAVLLWFTAIFAVYRVCQRHAHHYAGLCAAILLAHCIWWERNIAGGYPRATGTTMTLLFLAAWLDGRRRLCLLLLVVMAATYPSPMMGCGLAFGVWTLWCFIKDRQWRPVLELGAASVLIIGFALSQDLLTPDWYGPTVWYDDVVHHPAWQRGSRFEFIPLPPVINELKRYLSAFYLEVGTPVLQDLGRWDRAHTHVIAYTPVVVLGVIGLIRRRFFGFPPRVLLLFVGGFGAFMLARLLAFKLHIPTRPLTHMWPGLLAVIIVLSIFLGLRALFPRRPAIGVVFGVLLTLFPMLALQGVGYERVHLYGGVGGDIRMYEWIQKNTPKDALFAGDFRGMDLVGLFGHRTPYVNWTLAHPYRLGYFNEIERRTSRMYEALWATDLETVLKFTEEEHITHFLIDVRLFKEFEDRRTKARPFPPLRAAVRPFFDKGRKEGFAMKSVDEAVIYKLNQWRIVEVSKLRTLAAQRAAEPVPGPSGARSGPEVDTNHDVGESGGAPQAP